MCSPASFGSMTIINVLAGEAYGVDATALEGFSTTAIWAEPGSVDPTLSFVNPKTSIVTSGFQTYVTDWTTSGKAVDHDGKTIKPFSGGGDHMGNFIAAVKSRKRDTLFAEIEEGHLSSSLCHTGNISYKLGRAASPDEIREALKADKAACETLERFQSHLAANEVDLKVSKATLGAFLKMDPKTERFIGNEKANAHLTREYRAPFVVPEKV